MRACRRFRPSRRRGGRALPGEILVTMGDDVNAARKFMKQDENGRWGYSATDVVDYLVSEWEASGGEEGVVVPAAAEDKVAL